MANMSRSQAYTILIICNLFGSLGVFGGLQIYLHARASSEWPSVEGKITSTEVVGGYTDSVKSYWVYHAVFKYAYAVEGREYQGDRRTFRPPEQSFERPDIQVGSDEEAQEAAKKYSVGKIVRVFYSPDDPRQSVLEPGVSTRMLMPALIGALIMGFSTTFVVAAAGQELLPRIVWFWLRGKFAGEQQADSVSTYKAASTSWANEILEQIDHWEPGVCVSLTRVRTSTISLMFNSTLIGASLGIAGGVFILLATLDNRRIATSTINSTLIVFVVSSLFLFLVSRIQDRRVATTVDWLSASYTVLKDFTRTRCGSLHDIQRIIVRCHQPRTSVRRFRAIVELQLPDGNVAIAQNDQLRRKPSVAKKHAGNLALPLAKALEVPVVFEGFRDDSK